MLQSQRLLNVTTSHNFKIHSARDWVSLGLVAFLLLLDAAASVQTIHFTVSKWWQCFSKSKYHSRLSDSLLYLAHRRSVNVNTRRRLPPGEMSSRGTIMHAKLYADLHGAKSTLGEEFHLFNFCVELYGSFSSLFHFLDA